MKYFFIAHQFKSQQKQINLHVEKNVEEFGRGVSLALLQERHGLKLLIFFFMNKWALQSAIKKITHS